MYTFSKILTGIFFCGIMIFNSADAALYRLSMWMTDINFDENNNLVVDGTYYTDRSSGCDGYTSGYFLKIIIKDLNVQNYVYTSWEKYNYVQILLKIDNFDNSFISGEGFIPVTNSKTRHPIDYEMQFFYNDNPSG